MLLSPANTSVGSPPLARGIHVKKEGMFDTQRITPACAGNTFKGWLPKSCLWDHPRLRGEYVIKWLKPVRNTGSPPLARGILNLENSDGVDFGITPACAGNTVRLFSLYGFPGDHPRLRGEY